MSRIVAVEKIFDLKYNYGLTHTAIAKQLDCDIKTITRTVQSDEFKAITLEVHNKLMLKTIRTQSIILDFVNEMVTDIIKDNDKDRKLKALNILSKYCNISLRGQND